MGSSSKYQLVNASNGVAVLERWQPLVIQTNWTNERADESHQIFSNPLKIYRSIYLDSLHDTLFSTIFFFSFPFPICIKTTAQQSEHIFLRFKKITCQQLAKAKKKKINLLFILHTLITFNEYYYVSPYLLSSCLLA